jgi:hypothetical protein
VANYYAAARSNYFRVADRAAFGAWADSLNLTVEEGDAPGNLMIHADEDGWPAWAYDADGEELADFDLPQALGQHLAPGETAILMESGAEKLRYIVGWAVAVHRTPTGGVETEELSLRDIYERAQTRWGGTITEASY